MANYSRKKHPYGFTSDDFKIKNLSNVFKLGKRPKVHRAALVCASNLLILTVGLGTANRVDTQTSSHMLTIHQDSLKELQAEQMDLELTSTEQLQTLDEAVSQFRDTFPFLFLEEPEKREYAVKHFLMALHQAARQLVLKKRKSSSSQAPQMSTTSEAVKKRDGDRLGSAHVSDMEITDNEDEEDENDEDDELDQLSVFDRKSPAMDSQRANSEESSSPTYVDTAIESLRRQKPLRVIQNPMATSLGSGRDRAPPISQTLARTPPPMPIAGLQPGAYQPPPSAQLPARGTPISLNVGNGVTITISTGTHGANATANPAPETGANFVYEFLSTCQPPLTTLLPKFMKHGCGNQYLMRGISAWDAASRRALLEKIVMDPVDDGDVYAGQKPLPLMVDILEHHFMKYFLHKEA